jgi:hypothetical protein
MIIKFFSIVSSGFLTDILANVRNKRQYNRGLVLFLSNFFFIFLEMPIAFADWQWTKWGMTPQQVVSASKGVATLTSPDRRTKLSVSQAGKITMDAKLTAPYSANGFSFTAAFLFDVSTEGLKCVSLELVSGNANSLEGQLTTIYGKIDRTRAIPPIGLNASYWDRNDEISLVTLRDSFTTLRYCSKDRGGL